MDKQVLISKINDLFESEDIAEKRELQKEILTDTKDLKLQHKVAVETSIAANIDTFEQTGKNLLTLRESAIRSVD